MALRSLGVRLMAVHNLTEAERERLAVLSEELGEAQQVIGKILRHGYESKHPFIVDSDTNRASLSKELGDIGAAMTLMIHAGDVFPGKISYRIKDKLAKIRRWLHEDENLQLQLQAVAYLTTKA